MRLLYTSDPLNPKIVDETYMAEYEAAKAAGFEVSIFSFEDFMSGNFRPRPAPSCGEDVIFRGWMLPVADYERLISAITSRGSMAFTSTTDYQKCHYLPNWYPFLKEFTAETVFLSEDSDFVTELSIKHWSKYFVKDYVKSVSTAGGAIASEPEDIGRIVSLMKKYRGLIEGGICVRKYEDYLPDTERRFFVFRGKTFSVEGDVPELVYECASRINSPFFSIDVAQRSDGKLRVIELGDGQVSDRKEWAPEKFISILMN